VNGHKLELVSYDDGYEPEKAIANTKRLITEDARVRASRRSRHTHFECGAADRHRGGRALHRALHRRRLFARPALKNVINIRGSYDQETEAWIEHLTKDLGISKIAILYQDDTFGRAGLSGVQKAMDKRGHEAGCRGHL
jgi:ABC-type branched-subunit amino acid transport system substrate-binding protein